MFSAAWYFFYIKKWHIESIYKWWVQLLFFLIHSYRPSFFLFLSFMLLAHSSIAWILISIKRRIEKIIVSDFFHAYTLFWPYSIIFELFVWLYLSLSVSPTHPLESSFGLAKKNNSLKKWGDVYLKRMKLLFVLCAKIKL